MPLNVSSRKFLLAGTALVAVSAFAPRAQAAPLSALTGDATWASSGAHDNTPNDASHASAGDDLNLNGHELTVTNDGDADDGSGDTDTFELGAITSTQADGALTIQQGAGGTADFSVTIGSLASSGTTAVSVSNLDGEDHDVSVSVDGAFGTGSAGNLAVTNNDTAGTSQSVSLELNVNNGATVIGGTTTLTAGAGAGATTSVVVHGAATFTGAVSIAGGAGANATATLGVKGATTVFNGGLTLNDGAGTGAEGLLVVSGTAGQTVGGTGALNGTAGKGVIVSENNGGVVEFQTALGGTGASTQLKRVEVNGTGGTTFDSTVNAKDIVLNSTAGATTFEGAVTATKITASDVNADGHHFEDAVTADVSFTGDSSIVLEDGVTLTGKVTNDSGTNNFGTLTLAGDGHVTGTIGAVDNSLKRLDAGAGDADFDGAVFAQAIHINGTESVNFDDKVTAEDIIFDDAGTVTFNKAVAGDVSFAGQDGTVELIATDTTGTGAVAAFTGEINSATTDDHGTLILAGGAQTVTGAVGATKTLHEVRAGQTATAVSTFSGIVNATTISVGPGRVNLNDTTAADISFTDDGTLHVKDGKNITGDVDTTNATDPTGTFVFDGNSIVTGNFGLVNQLKGLSLVAAAGGATSGFTGDVIAAKTTDLGLNTLSVGGTYTQAADDTLKTSIKDGTHYGKITVTDTATIAAGSTVALKFDVGFTDDATVGGSGYDFTLVDGDDLGTGIGAVTLTGGGALWTLTQTDPGGDTLVVHAVKKAVTSITTPGNNTAAMNALSAAVLIPEGAALQPLYDSILQANTAGQINQILAAIQPTVDGSSQQGVMAIGSQVRVLTETRLAALRSGDGVSGMAAGVANNGGAIWAQGFAGTGTQDARDGIGGYDSDLAGGAIGYDTTELLEDGALGIALTYGTVDADSKNINRTQTDITSYGLSVYGNINLPKGAYLDASAGYAYNDIDIMRYDTNGPGTGTAAHGDTHSDQYSARAVLARDYQVRGGTTLTPAVSADYAFLRTQGYQESGDGTNLNVGDSEMNTLNLGVDLKASWRFRTEGGDQLKPSIHAGYAYDVIGDRLDNAVRFMAPGLLSPAYTIAGPDPERSTGTAGVGLTYYSLSDWDLSANYNYTFRSDYDDQSGVLRVSSRF